MTDTANETASPINGDWNIAWLGMSPKVRGTLTLAVDGPGLSVQLDSPLGSGKCEGKADGSHLTWTITLDKSPEPLQFDAVVAGDEISGTVTSASQIFGPASLEGVRAGSRIKVRSRIGSEALAESLDKCGVEYVFGFSGGATTSLERSIMSPEYGLKTMAGRTELGAAWMSYGFNRMRRRVASAVSVWCVGAMHSSPVVYAAKLDSTPLVFLAMEHSTAWDFRDILQDSTELYSALKPISKYAKRLVNVEDVPVAVRQAVLAASTGKPGPAVLCLTYAAMNDRTTLKSEELVLPSPPAASEGDVSKTLEIIAEAERPVLLAGAGVHLSGAAAELRAFAEATGIPVVTSGSGGRGVLPDDHPLYAGDSTIWGGFPTGIGLAQDADLWIAVGFSFSQPATHSWTLKKPDKVVQVDIDPNQLGRIFQPTLGVVADAGVFLSQLNAQVRSAGKPAGAGRDEPRISEIRKAKEALFHAMGESRGATPIMPTAMGQVLAEEVPDGTLIVNDEGFMVAGMLFREAKYPSGFATALGFHYASLGSTLPVAIGAKLAEPDRTVISFGGDGGFFYDCGELATLAQNDIKVITIINNNSGLYGGRRGRAVMEGPPGSPFTDYSDSNMADVARGFGVQAERIEKYEDFTPALRRALAAKGPYLLDVVTGGSNLSVMQLAEAMNVPPKFGHGDPKAEGSWPGTTGT